MIAVTGATGQLGKSVVQHLSKRVPAESVVALVRDPAKAEGLKRLGVNIRQADYEQPASWKAALEGVHQLLLISSSEVGRRESQHRTVVRAAEGAKIRHLIYTSILKADSSPLGLAAEHLATEKAIRGSGLPFTFLRNGWYLENHTANLASALRHGSIQGAAQSGRFSSAAREDYALAAVAAITGAGHENKIYELAGDTSFSMPELASEVSRQAGKPVIYQDLSFDDYKKFLAGVGLPEPFAALLADSDVGASKGGLQSESKDLHRLIGRATTPLAEAVREALR